MRMRKMWILAAVLYSGSAMWAEGATGNCNDLKGKLERSEKQLEDYRAEVEALKKRIAAIQVVTVIQSNNSKSLGKPEQRANCAQDPRTVAQRLCAGGSITQSSYDAIYDDGEGCWAPGRHFVHHITYACVPK